MLASLARLPAEYSPVGHRYSNAVLQTLSVLLKKVPENEERRLLVVATTSKPSVLSLLELDDAFNAVATVPQLTKPSQIHTSELAAISSFCWL